MSMLWEKKNELWNLAKLREGICVTARMIDLMIRKETRCRDRIL